MAVIKLPVATTASSHPTEATILARTANVNASNPLIKTEDRQIVRLSQTSLLAWVRPGGSAEVLGRVVDEMDSRGPMSIRRHGLHAAPFGSAARA